MSCLPTYNNVRFASLASLYNINTNLEKSEKDDILETYNKYLDSIFPARVDKSIIWATSSSSRVMDDKEERVFYRTKTEAQKNKTKGTNVYPVILNITNPKLTYEGETRQDEHEEDYDGEIIIDKDSNKPLTYKIKEESQIYELGTKQEQDRLKEFLGTLESEEEKDTFIDNLLPESKPELAKKESERFYPLDSDEISSFWEEKFPSMSETLRERMVKLQSVEDYLKFHNAIWTVYKGKVNTRFYNSFKVAISKILSFEELDYLREEAKEVYFEGDINIVEKKLARDFLEYLEEGQKKEITGSEVINELFNNLADYLFNVSERRYEVETMLRKVNNAPESFSYQEGLAIDSMLYSMIIANLDHRVTIRNEFGADTTKLVRNLTGRELIENPKYKVEYIALRALDKKIKMLQEVIKKRGYDEKDSFTLSGQDKLFLRQYEFLNKVRNKIYDEIIERPKESIISRTLDKINKVLKIDITRSEDLQEAYYSMIRADDYNPLTRAWFDELELAVSSDKKMQIATKVAISKLLKRTKDEKGVPQHYVNPITGSVEAVNFAYEYPKLRSILNGVVSKEDLFERLKEHSHAAPHYLDLIENLKNDENTLQALLTDSSMIVPTPVYIQYEKQGVQFLDKSKKNPEYFLSNTWVERLREKLANNYYDKEYDKRTKGLKDDLLELIREKDDDGNDVMTFSDYPYKLEKISKVLEKAFKNLGINLNNEALYLYISDPKHDVSEKTVILDLFNRVSDIKDLLIKSKTNKDKIGSLFGKLNALAEDIYEYTSFPIEHTYATVDNNQQYNVSEVNQLLSFFNRLNNKHSRKEALDEIDYMMKMDKSLKFSNLLSSLVDYTNDLNYTLNSTFTFEVEYLDGLKNVLQGHNIRYKTSDNNTLGLMKLMLFNSLIKGEGENLIRLLIPIPGDSVNTYMIKRNIIHSEFEKTRDGVILNKDTAAYEQIVNTIRQEVVRMREAKANIFSKSKTGLKVIAKPKDTQKDRDYKIGKNGKRIYIEDGKVTGRIFQFHNVDTLNELDIFDSNGILKEDFDVNSDEVTNAINRFINRTHKNLKSKFTPYKKSISMPRYKDFDIMLASYAVNEYLNNVELNNLFEGNLSELPTNEKYIHRSKKVVQKGRINAADKSKFSVLVVNDVERDFNISSMLSNMVAKTAEKSNIEDSIISKMKKNIVGSYKGINEADGWGVMTLDRWIKLQKSHGRWDMYENLFTEHKTKTGKLRYTLKENLSPLELDYVFQILKPMYSDRKIRKFGKTYRMSNKYLKFSTMVLIPELTKDIPMLDNLRKRMEKTNIDEIVFSSVEKEGAANIQDIYDKETDTVNFNNILKENSEDLDNSSYKIQLDVADHHLDSENKLSVQFHKHIISNINKDYEYKNPISNEKKSGEEIINDHHNLLSTLIEKASKEQIEEMKLDLMAISLGEPNSLKKISNLLYRMGKDREFTQSQLWSISTKDNGSKFNVPLDFLGNRTKNISILNSIFTRNVTDLKFPGTHDVLASNVFYNLKSDKTSLEEGDLSKRLKSYVDKESGNMVVECAMGAWSRDFFDKNGKEIDIESIPEELRTMIGFRIPLTGKHSTVVLKVVKFIPRLSGSTVILPENLVAQTGWDFDVDSLFTMRYNHIKRTIGEENVIEFLDFKDIPDELLSIERIQNKLLSTWMSILNSPYHFMEKVTPADTKDNMAVKEELETLLGVGLSSINPTTADGQLSIIDLVYNSKTLLPMGASVASINTVYQALSARLKTPITFKFDKKDINPDVLKYFDYTTNEDGTITVEFYNIGKNGKGEFFNIAGTYITQALSEDTNNFVDGFKSGMIPGINPSTYNVYALLKEVGVRTDEAAYFVAQPSIRKFSNLKSENTTFRLLNQSYRNAEYETKTSMIMGMFSTLRNVTAEKEQRKKVVDDKIDRILDAAYSNSKDNRYYIANLSGVIKALGFKNEIINLSKKELEKQILLSKKIIDKTATESEIKDYYHTQWRVFYTFLEYQKQADIKLKVNKTLRTDKVGAGTNFEVTKNLIRNIFDIAADNSKHEIINQEGKSIITDVYPKVLGIKRESKYKTLEAFLLNSNVAAYNLFNSLFTSENEAYSKKYDGVHGEGIVEAFVNKFKHLYEDELEKRTEQFKDFANSYLISNHPLLRMNESEQKYILGYLYKGKSFSKELIDYISNRNIKHSDEHWTKYIQVFNSAEFKKNNDFMDSINFIDTENNNELFDYIQRTMIEDYFYGLEEDVDMIEKLVKFAYLTEGMSYKRGGIRKLIPEEILAEMGIVEMFEESSRRLNLVQGISEIFETSEQVIDNFVANNITSTLAPMTSLSLEVNDLDGTFKTSVSAFESKSDMVKESPYIRVTKDKVVLLLKNIGLAEDKEHIHFQLIEKRGGKRFVEPNYNQESIVVLNKVPTSIKGITRDTSDREGMKESREIEELERLESLSIRYPTTEKEINQASSKLKATFKKAGINVRVRANRNLSGHGRVVEENGEKIVEYNPDNVMNDTIFHEFGHILIDLCADEKFIDLGIEQVRGTELWNIIAEVYSDKTGRALGKEVLTTAIGLKATKLFESGAKLSGWKFWINRLWDRIREVLGLKTVDVVQRLAEDLVRGDLSKRLDYRKELNEQYQKDIKINRMLSQFRLYLNEKVNMYTTAYRQYRNSPVTAQYAKNIEETLNRVKVLRDRSNLSSELAAFVETLNRDRKTLSALERSLENMFDDYFNKKIDVTTISRERFLHLAKILYKTREFLDSFDSVDILEFVEQEFIDVLPEDKDKEIISEINTIIKETKSEESIRISNLRNRFNALRPKVISYIISLSTDPNIKDYEQEARKLFDEGLMDETNIQLMLDALFDSNNVVAANLTKFMFDANFKAERETNTLLREYIIALENFEEAGFTVDDIADENGKLHSKYNLDLFYSTMNDEAKTPTEKRIFISENSKKTYEGSLADLIETKRKELSDIEFHNWYNRNVMETNTGEVNEAIGGELLELDDKFINSKWKKLNRPENAKALEFHTYLFDLLEKLTVSISKSPQKDGQLPAIPKHKVSYKDVAEKEALVLTNMSDEVIHQIPFKYLGFLMQENIILIPEKLKDESKEGYEARILKQLEEEGKGKFESLKEVREENKRRSTKNRAFHKEFASRDLRRIIPMFIKEGIKHKYKSEIENSVLLTAALVRQGKIRKLNGLGKNVHDFWKRTIEGGRKTHTIAGAESNVSKHIDKHIEMIFYEKYVSPSKGDVWARRFKHYSSLLGLGFNVFAGVKNFTYGEFMIFAEASAGFHFGGRELREASLEYTRSIPSLLADVQNRQDGDYSGSSTISSILRFFNIVESYDEHLEKVGDFKTIAFRKTRKIFDAVAYGMLNTAEHAMHNTPLLAMLKSNRVIDGKTMSLQQFISYKKEKEDLKLKGDDIKEGAAVAKEKVRRIKQLEKDAKEEFKTYPTVRDVLVVEEDNRGKIRRKFIKIKEVDGKPLLSDYELGQFKQKVISVNHKIHGIYNKADKGTIENKMLGQLIMQFKHWARPGWNKRYGSRGGLFRIDEFWNERRNEYDIGDYKSFYKLVTAPYKLAKEMENIDKATAYQTARLVLHTMWHLLTKFKLYYHTLSPQERGNIKRMFAELVSLATVLFIASILRGVKADDDDEEVPKGFNFLLYQLDASRIELTTYTPVYGWLVEGYKMVSNPAAAIRLMKDTFKLAEAALFYPFQDQEKRVFRSGTYRGEYKIVNYAERVIPILNVGRRWRSLDSLDTAYR